MNLLRFFFRRFRSPEDAALAAFIRAIKRARQVELPYVELLQRSDTSSGLNLAIKLLAGVLNRNPKDEMSYRYLLVAYNKQGDLAALSNLVARHQKKETAHLWYLLHVYNNEDWNGAIALLTKLAELRPKEKKWAEYLATSYDRKAHAESPIAADRVSGTVDYSIETATGTPTQIDGEAERELTGIHRINAFEVKLAAEKRIAQLDRKERERQRIEAAISRQLGGRPHRKAWVKPTGSRDGFG